MAELTFWFKRYFWRKAACDHVAVFPPALVLHRRVGRSSRHHPPGHADAVAVSGPVRLNLVQGAGGWLEGI